MENRTPALQKTPPSTAEAPTAGNQEGTAGETARRPAPGQRAGAPEGNKPKLQIPWNYGRNTLCAMVVDPVQLYLYWEVSDGIIARAKSRFGHKKDSWLHLRVYDTTDRLFDGSNAHNHVDYGVQRFDRQWFCQVNKPGSSAHAELGVKDASGDFIAIMRSGRVDFPRRNAHNGGQVEPHQIEWMTVQEDGSSSGHRGGWGSGAPPDGDTNEGSQAADDSIGEGTGTGTATPQGQTAESPTSTRADDGWSHSDSCAVETEVFSRSVEKREWRWESRQFFPDVGNLLSEDFVAPFESQWTTIHAETKNSVTTWSAQGDTTSWSAGPFSYPVEIETPSVEHEAGGRQVMVHGNAVRVLHGPWQVTIRGLGAHTSSQVLSRWSVHRTWSAPVERYRQEYQLSTGRSSLGASEQRLSLEGQWVLGGGSELRLGGSSEQHSLGASELRFLGASEQRFLSGSERRLLGASELRLGGASESSYRLTGSSENSYRSTGSSENSYRSTGSSENSYRLIGSGDSSTRAFPPVAEGPNTGSQNPAVQTALSPNTATLEVAK